MEACLRLRERETKVSTDARRPRADVGIARDVIARALVAHDHLDDLRFYIHRPVIEFRRENGFHPCGEIDVLAVDRTSKLTIIDFDTTLNDGLLLRGLGHFDWVVRNTQNVRRMYPAQTVDSSLPPRLVLLAPQFSAALRRVMRQFTHPQIQWVRYHTVDTPGGVGILFEPVTGE